MKILPDLWVSLRCVRAGQGPESNWELSRLQRSCNAGESLRCGPSKRGWRPRGRSEAHAERGGLHVRRASLTRQGRHCQRVTAWQRLILLWGRQSRKKQCSIYNKNVTEKTKMRKNTRGRKDGREKTNGKTDLPSTTLTITLHVHRNTLNKIVMLNVFLPM